MMSYMIVGQFNRTNQGAEKDAGKGASHAAGAMSCAKRGQPVGILRHSTAKKTLLITCSILNRYARLGSASFAPASTTTAYLARVIAKATSRCYGASGQPSNLRAVNSNKRDPSRLSPPLRSMPVQEGQHGSSHAHGRPLRQVHAHRRSCRSRHAGRRSGHALLLSPGYVHVSARLPGHL